MYKNKCIEENSPNGGRVGGSHPGAQKDQGGDHPVYAKGSG
jgi:hypothetical protein